MGNGREKMTRHSVLPYRRIIVPLSALDNVAQTTGSCMSRRLGMLNSPVSLSDPLGIE